MVSGPVTAALAVLLAVGRITSYNVCYTKLLRVRIEIALGEELRGGAVEATVA